MQAYSRPARCVTRSVLRGVVFTCARTHKRPAVVTLPPCTVAVRRNRTRR